MRHFLDEMLLSFRGKPLLAMVAIYSLFHGVSMSFSQTGTSADVKDEGKALVQTMLQRVPSENSEILGLLKIRPADGEVIEIPTKMTTQLSAEGWQDIYVTSPVVGHSSETLIVQHRGEAPNIYMYGDTKNASEKPRLSALNSDSLYRSLAGSDFYFADLGLEFLHWPDQRIVKKEMRKGRSCRVVQSINPNPKPGQYSRVLSWVDLETNGIIRAEGYDIKNKLLKEFSIRKVDRDEGRLKEIEIRNEQSDSRTRLEFNLKVE